MNEKLRGMVVFGFVASCTLIAWWALFNTVPLDLDQAELVGGVTSYVLNPAWAAVVTIAVALAALGIARNSPKYVAPTTAVVGCLVLAAPAAAVVPIAAASTIGGLGAGLLIGSAVAIASHLPFGSFALIAGAVCAAPTARWMGAVFGERRGWAVGLPGDTSAVCAPVPTGVLIAVALLALVTVYVAGSGQTDYRVNVRILALPVVFWFIYVFLGSTQSSTTEWLVAAAISIAVIGAAALMMGPEGAFLAAGLAYGASFVNTVYWQEWWQWGLVIPSVGIGLLLARRFRSTAMACCILAVVCATGFLAMNAVSSFAYAVLLPAAASYAYASAVPRDPAVCIAGIAIPLMMAVFSVSALQSGVGRDSFGWDDEQGSFAELAPSDQAAIIPSSAAGVAVAVAAALTGAVIAAVTARGSRSNKTAGTTSRK